MYNFPERPFSPSSDSDVSWATSYTVYSSSTESSPLSPASSQASLFIDDPEPYFLHGVINLLCEEESSEMEIMLANIKSMPLELPTHEDFDAYLRSIPTPPPRTKAKAKGTKRIRLQKRESSRLNPHAPSFIPLNAAPNSETAHIRPTPTDDGWYDMTNESIRSPPLLYNEVVKIQTKRNPWAKYASMSSHNYKQS